MMCASQEKIIKLNNENLLYYKCVYVGARPCEITNIQDGEESRPGSAINEEEKTCEWNQKLTVLRDESTYNMNNVVEQNLIVSKEKYLQKNTSVRFFLCTKHEKCRKTLFELLKNYLKKINCSYLKIKNDKKRNETKIQQKHEKKQDVAYDSNDYNKFCIGRIRNIKYNKNIQQSYIKQYIHSFESKELLKCYNKQKIVYSNNNIIDIEDIGKKCKQKKSSILYCENKNNSLIDEDDHHIKNIDKNNMHVESTNVTTSNYNINSMQIRKYEAQKQKINNYYTNKEQEISSFTICYDEYGDIVFDIQNECCRRCINKPDQLYCYFMTEYCSFTLRDYIDLRNDVYFTKKENKDVTLKILNTQDASKNKAIDTEKMLKTEVNNNDTKKQTIPIKKAKKVIVVDAFGHTKKIRRDLIDISFTSSNKLNKLFVFILMRNILNGLLSLHSNNIIHGDLKPSNIFFNKNLTPKIGDFGLSFVTNKIYDDECFDVKQIGLIYFELLWPIKTVMERVKIIERIEITKELPTEFVKKYKKDSKIIRKCLVIDRDKKMTVEKLLRKLDKLYMKKINKVIS
ncbi:eukaryotic translation initiation factor 2-alpha kinase [Binucleata daphniae]